MLIFILLGLSLLIAIVVAILAYLDYNPLSDSLGIGFMNLVVGVVFSFFIYGLAFTFAPGGEKVPVTTKLSALGNDSELSGSFFLGSGSIDEKAVYQFIAQTEDGGYYLKTIPVRNVLVYTDATADTATYVDYIRMVDNWWLSSEPIQVSDNYTDEFHVPEGSVDFTYRVSVTD